MRLHEMPSEHLLDVIEERSETLLRADLDVGEIETQLKAYEATAACAHRDAGKSMAEAKERVRAGTQWSDLYSKLQAHRARAAHDKRSFDRAVIAQNLWRTERATLRHV